VRTKETCTHSKEVYTHPKETYKQSKETFAHPKKTYTHSNTTTHLKIGVFELFDRFIHPQKIPVHNQPPAPMNHAKYLRAGLPEKPLGSWYLSVVQKISARTFWSGGTEKANWVE